MIEQNYNILKTSPEDLKVGAMLEHLILQGGIVISGIDIDGVAIYEITDKLKFIKPELYDKMKEDFEERMFEMIDMGPKIMKWKLSI